MDYRFKKHTLIFNILISLALLAVFIQSLVLVLDFQANVGNFWTFILAWSDPVPGYEEYWKDPTAFYFFAMLFIALNLFFAPIIIIAIWISYKFSDSRFYNEVILVSTIYIFFATLSSGFGIGADYIQATLFANNFLFATLIIVISLQLTLLITNYVKFNMIPFKQ